MGASRVDQEKQYIKKPKTLKEANYRKTVGKNENSKLREREKNQATEEKNWEVRL